MKQQISFLLLFFSYVSFSQGNSDFQYQDKIYDEHIKTVQLYPYTQQVSSQTLSPVIGLRSNQQLILEFDELFTDAYSYKAKLIHCNAIWQPSGLSPLEYLNDYNEYDISDYEYSFGTTTPYVHYKFFVPKPTITGNYLLVVYAANDSDDIIISRRFMVFEQLVSFSGKYEIVNNAPYSIGNQILQFEVNYQGVELINPMEFVSVNILQNQRWDNAKIKLKPTYAREGQHLLDYKHFTNESSFKAGNDFRYFDIRSLKYFGHHVYTASLEKNKISTRLEKDKPRADLAYSIEDNINGRFFIENLERKISNIENDYALVVFTLESEQMSEDVYLSGKFANWQKNASTLMRYNTYTNSYEGSYVLKQGLYNYQYILGSTGRENEIEGNKRETNNLYEIFVYYRSQQLDTDLLIGYYNFEFGINR